MPTITIPSVPGVQRAQAPVANRNAAAEQAPYRGSMELAGAVGQVGETVQAFALRSARARNEADVARGRIEMQKAFAELQADLEANPNPQEWEKLAAARVEQAAGAAMVSQNLAPEAKQRLELEFKAWAQDTTLAVRNQAQRQQNAENDKALAQAQSLAIGEGDIEEAERYVEVRRRLGLISDTRAQLELGRVRVDVDKQLVARAINDDPMAAVDLLEDQTDGGRYRHFKNLSESDRIMALRSAKNARETARAETAQALSEEIYAGGLRSLGIDQRIDDAVTAGRILPSHGNSLKRLAKGDYNPQEAAARGSGLWRQAMALDRAAPDFIERSAQIRAQLHTLPPELKAPVLDVLKEVDSDSVTEDVRSAYAAFDRDFRANVYGNAQTFTAAEAVAFNKLSQKRRREQFPGIDPERTVSEGDAKNVRDFENASLALWRNQKAMRQWLQANPKATFEQIARQREVLTASDPGLATDFVDLVSAAAP